MLHSDKNSIFPTDQNTRQSGASINPLTNSIGIVRRQFLSFLIIVPCTLLIGVVYLATAKPMFTASATVEIVDARRGQLFQQTSVLGEPTFDASWMQSQIEAVKSKNVSLAVIKNLKLTEDSDFMNANSSSIATALSRIFAPLKGLFNLNTNSEKSVEQRALEVFTNHRTVSRVGLANDLEVSAISYSPQMAASIANAICNAFIADQLEAKYEITRQATQWLQERIDSLRADMTRKEEAVVVFKRNNNIVETASIDANEKQSSINDKKVTAINTQLILANAATSEAKARLDRITEVNSENIPDASVVDALKNEVIIRLRQQYLDVGTREALIAQKYGYSHLAAVALRNQMTELQTHIADEMRKIAESYKSDYEIALAHEISLRKSLEAAISNSHIEDEAQVQLRELQSAALSATTLYKTFLTRYGEAVQQQSFPVADARIISTADAPLRKSQPNTLGVLLSSVAGGMTLAFAVAIAREASERVFRTSRQVQDRLNLNCLAIIPKLGEVVSSEYQITKGFHQPRSIERSAHLLFYAVEAPFSQFTESLRLVKVLTDINSVSQATSVIGFTSTVPNEGKSTIAANYAAMVAHSGARVALVDADLRRSSLSKRLSPHAVAGLIDVGPAGVSIEDAGWMDQETGLFFVPAGINSSKLIHPNEFLASKRFESLIDRLRDSFDHVIIDLAPLSPVSDTRATVKLIDSYIYVIEWGVTEIESVENNLSNAAELRDKILGVVLNKVDMKILKRYEGYQTNSAASYYDYRVGKPVT